MNNLEDMEAIVEELHDEVELMRQEIRLCKHWIRDISRAYIEGRRYEDEY